MNQRTISNQSLLNVNALLKALGTWLMPWLALVLVLTYRGEPSVICLTPMAWLLAIPAGWNYVALARGNPGRQPFLAGALVGALLGLLYGLLYCVVALYTMPDDAGPENGISTQGLALIIVAAGTLFAAFLSGLMAMRAASLQRRGKELAVLSVK